MRRPALRVLKRFGVLAILAASVQCGGATSEPPVPPVISINAGNSQSAAVGTAVTTPPSVKVLNATGQGVAGIAVTFSVASGGGSVSGGSQTTNSSGVATVTSWTLGTQLGLNSVTASATGTTGGPVSFTATALAGPATTIALDAGNSQSVILGSPVTTPPSVRVTDAGGNPVTGATVTFAVGTGGGTVTGGTATTLATGIATVGSWTPGAVGSNTLTATSTGLTGSPITFTATAAIGPASKLAVKTAPSTTATNRTAFAVQPLIQVADINGNAIAQAGTVVTASLTTGGGTLGGTLTATTNAAGVATFTNLSISGTASAKTLTFSATGLTAATAPVTTTAGAAASLVIDANNAQSAVVSTALTTPPSVKATDLDANPVSGVAVTFAVTGGGGTATGLTQSTDALGVAKPTTWTLGPTPGANTMTATSAGLTGSPVTLTATGTAGPPAKLVMQTQPAGAVAGVPFTTQPVVKITDAAGNTVLTSTLAVTVSITSGTGTLNGATTVNAVAGVATFSLAIIGTGGPNTLSFATTGLTGVSSASFTVAAPTGGATTLVVTTDPAGATSGVPFTTQPVVEGRTGSGILSTTFQSFVTASIASGTGTLGGTTSVQALGGVAHFTNLKINGTGAFTLKFTAAPMTPASTGSITVAPPSVVEIQKFSADTLAVMAGATVAIKPSVKVLTVGSQPAVGVTVNFAVATGGGSITGATAVTDANGVATVGSWTSGATAGQNTLTASVVDANVIGNPVTFTAAGCTGSGAGFRITVCFVSDMTASQRAVFTTAAAKWESIVVGDQSDITFTSGFSAGTCGASTGGTAPGTLIDDLLIFAAVVPIDGVSGVLGNASPCHTRNSNGIPVTGSMRFDVADVNNLEANGTLASVITHEMGHVLGIGTLWATKLLVQNPTSTTAVDTYYSGTNGIAGFNLVGGNTYTGGQKVPVANVGGTGTINTHWRESVLVNELMTGILNNNVANPLSILTVKSLIDLGYTVDETKAEPFFLTLSLRAGGSDTGIPMLNDVYFGPLLSVDTRGRIVRRLR